MAGIRRHTTVAALLTGFVALAASVPAIAQEAPRVVNMEPPNWWPGHSINPVRLLIHGENLSGATVGVARQGVAVERIQANASGTYLFVDVRIAPDARPGTCPLVIQTSAGEAAAPFAISSPLPREGRFQGFCEDDVFYLVMTDRFANGDPSNDDPQASRGMHNRSNARHYHGGDLQGVIDRLPYLKDLGVTVIWLTPIYDNVNRIDPTREYDGQAFTDYHGYGVVDFYALEEHFGDVVLFRELVDRAHDLGIKIVEDQIANHTGPQHPWVQDPPTNKWYNGTQKNHLKNQWQTWTLLDPYATPETQAETLKGWFGNILPDLNQDDEEVKRYLIQNTLWWLGMTGLDGVRQDTLPYVHRRFWRDWTGAIKREYPDVNVLGEMWDGDAAKVSFFQGGRARFDGIDSGIDALFDFPMYDKLRFVFAGGNWLRDIPETLSRDRLYPNPNMLVTFLGLHDVARFTHESSTGNAGMKLAYTFQMTARGIPLVYYGDEIAMRGGGDPDNRRDFPGGWPEDERDAFADTGRTDEEKGIFNHLRKLTRLRAELKPLRRGRTINLHITEQSYVYARACGGETVIVALNNATEATTIECPVHTLHLAEGVGLRDRLGDHPSVRVSQGQIPISLTGRNGAVFTIE